jgi:predicted acetyltransferase
MPCAVGQTRIFKVPTPDTAALVAAREQGYDTAVLEPSPIGAPMYRRMGFEPIGTYLEAIM